jgi:hypothetical protein
MTTMSIRTKQIIRRTVALAIVFSLVIAAGSHGRYAGGPATELVAIMVWALLIAYLSVRLPDTWRKWRQHD